MANRKKMNVGKLLGEKLARFEELLALVEYFKRVNRRQRMPQIPQSCPVMVGKW